MKPQLHREQPESERREEIKRQFSTAVAEQELSRFERGLRASINARRAQRPDAKQAFEALFQEAR